MRFNLKWKMALIGLLPLCFYVFSGIYLLSELVKTNKTMSDEVYGVSARSSALILNADRDLYQAYSAYQYLAFGQLDESGKAEWSKALDENMKDAADRVNEAKGIFEANSLLELKSETGTTIGQLIQEFNADFRAWETAVSGSVQAGNAAAQDNELRGQFEKARAGLDDIDGLLEQYAGLQIEESKEKLKSTESGIYVGMGLAILLLAALIAFTIQRVMRTVRTVMVRMNRVAEGDLTAERNVKYSKDELGDILRSVDDMIGILKRLITSISSSAKEVGNSTTQLNIVSQESATASQHVAVNIQEVTGGTEIQARSAEETAKAMEEMTIGIQRLAQNTTASAEQSVSTASEAGLGQEALERLIGQMGEVKGVIGQLSDIIDTLETRSQQIGAIAENITAFANQTNILSLNASIEAARAGEQGRGFAVVAGEIRKLAASSLESAEGIHQLVAETRGEISGASSYMARTLEEVQRGNNRVEELQQSLAVIVAAIDHMTAQLQENSAITEQMSASSEQVNASMEQAASSAAANLERTESVAAATEEQLALMESIASAASQLDGVSRELNREINYFKVN
ncbi:HAMP domain-containing methyl-accepting chemotaxis protein [Paenibacillus glycanilyticus]|uniref:methyl-accepting chemotaxis protein n=1 Tax=Paenibacillus glycanilyticus TaxID=126569 RepID=UPI00203E0DA5|nr:HAMP domain-containing methyl-accepting chemotaxis protein [Paenibacillus glycanilyticus]MCM3626415.1 HAMP domain-containing methyl-accepting chemotaxis protein [Paenibacillus glycanilyticus]